MRKHRIAILAAVGLALGLGARLAAQTPAATAPAAPVNPGPQVVPGGAAQTQAPGTTIRRGANFPNQTREQASADVIARGKALYLTNCASCHAADMRGGDMGGPNLVRSQLAMSDQHGELIGPVIHGSRASNGMPALNLSDVDTTAVAEYIHSVLYDIGRQGRPPNDPSGADLKVIVGDPLAGKAYFGAKCASCHSVTGDLAGFGAKYTDGRQLQNMWVQGGRGGTAPATVTVTMINGQTVQGTLVRKDDFIVTLIEADGTRRTISRNAEVKSVDVKDPRDAHKNLAMHLEDKDMHDVTAYLATVK